MKELDSLLRLLGERKRKLEQEEAESNMEVLLDFLQLSRQMKHEELKEVNILQSNSVALFCHFVIEENGAASGLYLLFLEPTPLFRSACVLK